MSASKLTSLIETPFESVDAEFCFWGEKLNGLVPDNSWIGLPGEAKSPIVAAYRLDLESAVAVTHEVYVHAEERYELFWNGVRLGRGSERGDRLLRFCELYRLDLRPGKNRLLIRVFSLGDTAPFAQMTGGHRLMVFSADPAVGRLLGTGAAPWLVKPLPGYGCEVDHPTNSMTGPSFRIDGRAFAWDWSSSEVSGGWEPAVPLPAEEGIALYRAALPPQAESIVANGCIRHVDAAVSGREEPVQAAACRNEEIADWQRFLDGVPITVPPHTVRRVIIDLDDYRCFYPSLRLSGGGDAVIRLAWLEALYTKPTWHCAKGNRDELEGKYFYAPCDTFIADGGQNREFAPLWWRSGRYLELHLTTADTPLKLEALTLRGIGYPLPEEAEFQCSDPELNRIRPLLVHSLRMCSHETYMDCPYYEQLMYVGDTRLEVLVNYVMTRDHRLARKALCLFHESIRDCDGGLTRSRYPSSRAQIIPPFSLWWIAMVHDYALWHDEPEPIRAMLPGVRQVLATFAATTRSGSVLATGPVGWNFYDWVGEEWPNGVPPTQRDWTWGHLPPGTKCGQPPQPDAMPNSIMNHHYAMVLMLAAELEEYVGDGEEAERCRALGRAVTAELLRRFWRDDRNLFADDLEGKHYSEHAQILALLAGLLPEPQVPRLAEALLRTPDLSRTTIYFSHYLLEVIGRFADYGELRQHLQLWFGLTAQGFRTTPECPEPSRSDCHAWGSHPYYHFFATVAGIRPVRPGGKTFVISPLPGLPERCSGSLPLRQGDLTFVLRREREQLEAEITLPVGVGAVLIWNRSRTELMPGINRLTV